MSKRGRPAGVNAQFNSSDEAARHKVNPDLSVREILTRLAEHGVRVCSMTAAPFGEAVFFIGGDAGGLRATALAACYGEKPEKRKL